MKNMIYEVIKLKWLKYRANRPESITQKLTFCKITCTSNFGVLVQGVQQKFFFISTILLQNVIKSLLQNGSGFLRIVITKCDIYCKFFLTTQNLKLFG